MNAVASHRMALGLAMVLAGLPLLGATSVAGDPALASLLRFMAVLKAGMALAAAALLVWRFARPTQPAIAAAAIAAVSAMTAAAALIWRLHVIEGALLFHAGLLLFAGLAWRDERAPQRRLTTTTTSLRLRKGNVQGGS